MSVCVCVMCVSSAESRCRSDLHKRPRVRVSSGSNTQPWKETPITDSRKQALGGSSEEPRDRNTARVMKSFFTSHKSTTPLERRQTHHARHRITTSHSNCYTAAMLIKPRPDERETLHSMARVLFILRILILNINNSIFSS